MTLPRPIPARALPAVEPRLAISSSLPKPKELIAAAVSLFLVADSPHALALHVPSSSTNPNVPSVEFKPEHIKSLTSWFADALAQAGISDDQLLLALNTNPLVETQMEPLQVGLGLVWSIATVEFEGSESNSSERTGAARYPKVLKFTANMDIIGAQILSNPPEYQKVLLNWLGLHGVSPNPEFEEYLERTLTVFTETALFQIKSDSGDTLFRNEGIYEAILSSTESANPVVSLKNKHGKGPVRILNSSINSGLNPYLEKAREGVKLASQSSRDQLGAYASRVEELLSWANKLNANNTSTRVAFSKDDDSETTMEIDLPRNTIFYGVPGSGKSYKIKSLIGENVDQITRIVFHSEFSYGDFVGQILPQTKNDRITYEFTPGPFSRTLKAAIENPSHNHYLVIEEINRANAPGVFGDIFQLLDRNENGVSEYTIENEQISRYLFEDPAKEVYLPSNFYLLATMNTSDQNVFTLDTAFQRRWAQHLIPNDVKDSAYGDVEILDTEVTWSTFVQTVNHFMVSGISGSHISEDKQLGAYFISKDALKWRGPETPNAAFANSRFAESVIKYLWEDAFKYDRSLVFDDPIHTLEQAIKRFNESQGANRFQIFNGSFIELLKEGGPKEIELPSV